MVFITQQTLRKMYVNIINRRDSGLNINQRIKILKAKILLKAMPLTLFTSPQAAKNTQDRPVRLASSLPAVRLPPSLPSSLRGGKGGSSDTSASGEIQGRCERGVSIFYFCVSGYVTQPLWALVSSWWLLLKKWPWRWNKLTAQGPRKLKTRWFNNH